MLSEHYATVILEYARQNMTTTQAAKELYYSYNGLRYCLKKIKETTGLNPHNFFDLVELVKMAQEVLENE